MNLIRTATLIIMCAFAGVSLRAENYPSRNDLLWVTNPDHADWLYETGDSAVIEVQLYRYGVPVDGVNVSYTIG
ncbi:MAG: acetylxylan esterase, partial [Duncaniella sp.]|nr:acetylxylan esterase [Duncaniella sp.]